MAGSVSRRDFARLFALGGSAALFSDPVWAREYGQANANAFAPTISGSGEAFWKSVRAQVVMPPELGVLNAANLCPASRPVLEALKRETDSVDKDPSAQNRARLSGEKENLRTALATFLRATPEEIVITRNTSEANNMVSSGLDLKAGDEVIVFQDNHPSNLTAWNEKAKRFGYTVITIPQKNPHPGMEYYLDAYKKAITPRTRVLAFTHQTSTVGDVLPVKELCRVARERNVLTLVDGASALGLFDVDLSDLQPDFYTGSSHKWTCGPKEVGVLYVSARAQSRLHPSIISAYAGTIGASRTLEAMGQRDEPAIIGFGEAVVFETKIGLRAIEARSRGLAQALIAGLRRIDGVHIWTHPDPARSGAVVTFRPGTLDIAKLAAALYKNDRIGCATRTGSDRPGIRFSPHIYNTMAEVDRAVSAVAKYMKQGV